MKTGKLLKVLMAFLAAAVAIAAVAALWNPGPSRRRVQPPDPRPLRIQDKRIRTLVLQLKSPETHLGTAAAEALGRIGDPRAAGALREIVEEAHH